jgi:hypothetical protein
MIRYVIICKDYKKGNQCAKHVSHTLEQGHPEGDVLILRLKDGKEKAWSFELDPGVRTIVTNDVSSKDTKALSELEVWIESRKRKNITR